MGWVTKGSLLFLLFSVVVACGSSSSSSSNIIVTAPDASGTVFVSGTAGAVSGAGTVTATNLTPSASASTLSAQATGCETETGTAHSDGSFVSLSICADVDHQIQITHTDSDGVSNVVGTAKVPATSAASCPSPDQRLFTIKNESSQDIWLGVTAGTISCFTDADCPTSATNSCAGSDPATQTVGFCTCNNSASECGTVAECNPNNKQCFFSLPEMGIAQMNLAAGTGSSVLCFPIPTAGKKIQWSGNMFPRTGCNATGQACETGECASEANGPCPTGKGGNPPVSLFEFTFTNQTIAPPPDAGPDFYDISIIGGINLGVEVGPIAGTFAAVSGDPYSCETAGNRMASGELSACPWTVNPTVEGVDRSTILRNVRPFSFTATGTCPSGGSPNSLGFCVCTADSDCDAGQFCGNALNAATDSKFASVCGDHIAWWTANAICGASISTTTPFGDPINCADTITNSDMSLSTITNLQLCTKPDTAPNPEQAQSCYNDKAISDCCGCATSSTSPFFATWDLPLNENKPGTDNECFATNTDWENLAQPWLVFLKTACPTAYTYPFDDATSTFTCNKGSTNGPPAYQLTFFDAK